MVYLSYSTLLDSSPGTDIDFTTGKMNDASVRRQRPESVRDLNVLGSAVV